MILSHKARVKMENLIYGVFDRLDPTKTNTDFYRSFFSKMTDNEFDKFFDEFIKDPNAYLNLDIATFEHDLSMDGIEKCAKFMGVPLYEHVVMPFYSEDKDNPIVTPYPVPVGFIHEKRVQQTAIKKNSTSIDITMRDAKTNQVINNDKNARESIEENYAMMTYGAVDGVKEFMSFRADDNVMKEEAYSKIRRDGYVSMKELPDDISNKAAVNTFDTYMIGMGLKTDIVTEGYLVNKTLK